MDSPLKRRKWLRILIISTAIIFAIYLILLIPDPDYTIPKGAGKTPFAWNQDQYWSYLETQFTATKSENRNELDTVIAGMLLQGSQLIDSIAFGPLPPDSPIFGRLEAVIFELAPMVGACPDKYLEFESLVSRLKIGIKKQSMHWDMNDKKARDTVYRLLYGSREALEEILLQMPDDSVPATIYGSDEPSQTPSTKILGVTIHSGDILVSRGGAPTSALIARGNDYPGNFSHVALVYVDPKTNFASIIEAHIERGVVISTLEEYLRDKKLRVMILRPNGSLPIIKNDPMLPHKIAASAFEEAHRHHVPYDFAMDSRDHSKKFCSEVASAPYDFFGLHLWMGKSNISSRGLISWLAAFGVRHFETQEPSDLEYDPQLQVVAEWRDPETLYKDHVDNAVIDIMLEGADAGDRLDYQWYMIPMARVMKGYCLILNSLGYEGVIPEGMDATAALRNNQFSKRHEEIKSKTLALAEEFRQSKGYRPPYWELVKLARQAKSGQL